MCVGPRRQGELTSLGLEEEVVTLHSLSGNTESGFSAFKAEKWALYPDGTYGGQKKKNASMPDYEVTFWMTKEP